MSFLGFGNKKEDIDLTDGYRKKYKISQDQRNSNLKNSSSTSSSVDSSSFGFLGSMASASVSNEEDESNLTGDDKRRRLTKRLMDMTDKIEDLSNQIYHLTQRIELVERKLSISRKGE